MMWCVILRHELIVSGTCLGSTFRFVIELLLRETVAAVCQEEKVDFGLEPEAKAGLCLPVVCRFLAASVQQNSRHVLLSVEEKYLMKSCTIMCSDQISAAVHLSII